MCSKALYTTIVSDNSLHFRNNLLERIQEITMTIGGRMRDEKVQYDTDGEAVEIPAFSAGKIVNMYVLQAKKYSLPIEAK